MEKCALRALKVAKTIILINQSNMNEKVFVIYSEDLKGFLSNDGTSLTSDINNAMHYNSAGQAMMAAYKTTERVRGIFKFYEL